MGIYDRDYERQQRPYDDGYSAGGLQLRWPRTAVGWILLVTLGFYVVQALLGRDGAPLIDALGLRSDWWRAPWRVYTLLTYALLHAPNDVWHVVGNMFGFWLFGRSLEERHGARELFSFYLAAVLAGGLAFTVGNLVSPTPGGALVIGASAATAAATTLFALEFPHVRVLFMFVIPMPMWVLGALLLLWDVQGAMNREGVIACSAHLGGAALAAAYFLGGLRLSRFWDAAPRLSKLARRPQLRVHRDDDPDEDEDPVDRVLRKINEHGQASLTRAERRILEQASERFKQRPR